MSYILAVTGVRARLLSPFLVPDLLDGLVQYQAEGGHNATEGQQGEEPVWRSLLVPIDSEDQEHQNAH